MRDKLLSVLLLFVSLIICFIVGELAIRFIRPADIFCPKRSLMFTHQTFQLDSKNAVRYMPNNDIRTVAVYNGKIEYDVQFHTNNLGFIDHAEYNKSRTKENKKYYAFVGDSFTAGFHGGNPWVPKLRDKIANQNVEIYNLGVSGTGVEHFFRILMSAREQIKITHIVILAISGDIGRHFWYPLSNSTEIRFCSECTEESDCLRHAPIARVINYNSPKEEILRVAKEINKAEKLRYDNSRAKILLKKSRLLVFAVRTARHFLGYYKQSPDIKYSLTALRKIRDTFPSAEIHLIHLPQKDEIANNKYLLDIGKDVEEIGIRYFPALIKCRWSKSMYYSNDGHPTSHGYENISDCVEQYLFAKAR